MFAIRAERDFVNEEDFMKAVRKVRARTTLLGVEPERASAHSPASFSSYVAPIFRHPCLSRSAQVAENKKLEGTLSYSKV